MRAHAIDMADDPGHIRDSVTKTGSYMDRNAIAEQLRSLASDDRKRSKAAQLRDVIGDVEAALAAGVSRSLVVRELAAHGLEMTPATFETTLKRIRQKQGKPSITASKSVSPPPGEPTTSAQAPVVTPADIEAASAKTGSHDPADLDKIIGSKPDLEALVKLAKLAKRKVK